MGFTWRMEIPRCLFADPGSVECSAVEIAEDGSIIRLEMGSVAGFGICPRCNHTSRRVHSRYTRTLADLPWAGIPVQIRIKVRRFFCDGSECEQTIFSERLTVAGPWARRTRRLGTILGRIGVVVGASSGSKLCKILGMPCGIDTLLNLVRRLPLPAPKDLRVIGIDDWAYKKGQSYGTIVVDHESGEVVDLLPDRMPETVATWLMEHPHIVVVSRDRAEANAQAIRLGAPMAVQIADRWHLLKNLSEALLRVFQMHHQTIEKRLAGLLKSATEMEGALYTANIQANLVAVTGESTLADTEDRSSGTPAHQRRQIRVEEAQRLHREGVDLGAIAARLGVHPKTVRRSLDLPLPLSAQRSSRRSHLDPYAAYLRESFLAGCRNSARLAREIAAQGYRGGKTMVRSFVQELRRLTNASQRLASAGAAATRARIEKPPTIRHLAWCTTQPETALTSTQTRAISLLKGATPEIDIAIALSRRFAGLVREHSSDGLDSWLEEGARCGIAPLRGFAKGLQRDHEAVAAALSLPWSNGRTEGHVNRLKCVKRTMYGRAKLDLLRHRLLAA